MVIKTLTNLFVTVTLNWLRGTLDSRIKEKKSFSYGARDTLLEILVDCITKDMVKLNYKL